MTSSQHNELTQPSANSPLDVAEVTNALYDGAKMTHPSLHVDGNRFNRAEIAKLVALAPLFLNMHLDIEQCDPSIGQLFNAVHGHFLVHLALLSSAAIETIADVLQNATLECNTVSFDESAFAGHGAALDVILGGLHAKVLCMRSCGLGSFEMAAVGRNLGDLRVLVLEANDIDDSGVLALSQALRKPNRLEELYLGSNPFGSVGMISLASAIMDERCVLKLLDVYNAAVDDQAMLVKAFFDGHCKIPTLFANDPQPFFKNNRRAFYAEM